MKVRYRLNKTRRFQVGQTSFEMVESSVVTIDHSERQDRKVLIDFGDGLVDWFHESALDDFDELECDTCQGVGRVYPLERHKTGEPVLSWFDMDGEEGEPMGIVSVVGEIATYLDEDRRDLLLCRKALRAILMSRDLEMAKAIARDEIKRHVESA